MPARKKKSAGPQRGFATTSVAKKILPVETESDTEPATPPNSELGVREPQLPEKAGQQLAQQEDDVDPEEAELQNLAESLKPGCDKEIARITKVLEYDQRLSKTFPLFSWRDNALKEDVLRQVLEEESNQQMVKWPLQDQKRLISRLVTVYAVLERIGISKERILECFAVVSNIELDECLDWLALHCLEGELDFAGPVATEPVLHVFVDAAQQDRRTSTDNLSVPSSKTSNSGSSSATTLVTPPDEDAMLTPTANGPFRFVPPLGAPDIDLKQRILEAVEADSAATEESLEHDPTEAYVAARLELLSLTRQTDDFLTPKKQELEARMQEASSHYHFDARDADVAFKARRVALDAEALRDRLKAPRISSPEKVSTPSPSKIAVLDPSDTSEDESLFGDLLETPLREETTADGRRIRVFDMSIPKTWSGKSPKGLLEETLRRLDKFATANFRLLSNSRAFRAAVLIRWGSGRLDEFGMAEVGCQTEKQAYDYVATLALFPIATTPVHRQLPANFRDLWDQLLADREAEIVKAYNQHIKSMREHAAMRTSHAPEERKTATLQPSTPPLSEQAPVAIGTFATDEPSYLVHQSFNARLADPAYQEMLVYRNTLPIAAYRQAIVDAVAQNQVIILCGETGCGKSTQLPSYILESWLSQGRQANILCTEPRRISAISLAQRVSRELGEVVGSCGSRGSLVGYNVRLEARTSSTTRLVYATTGIALRMLEGDSSLDNLTHLIIDEVHERTIDSDFLMITLKEVLQRRPDLRLVLMSATVDAEKLSDYWHGCPVLNVPGRTFPVTSYFLEDVIEFTGYRLDPVMESPYARRHSINQHSSLVDGGSTSDDDTPGPHVRQAGREVGIRYSKATKSTLAIIDERQINFELLVMLLENICFKRLDLIAFSNAMLIFLPSLDSIRRLADMLETHDAFGSPAFQIFPLHSTISSDHQSLVFDVMPVGVRKIVLATNIAETGITIPDITCVIDSGRHREMMFDEKRQISRLIENFIARSNAAQRRGRAGRVQEGLAFAMFTRWRHDHQMDDHPQPEMLRLSLQDLALRIKVLEFRGTIAEVFLRALDPPTLSNIERAIAALVEVKALTASEEITTMGRHLAKLPVDVHLGKLLLLGCLLHCLDAVLTIVAALNTKSPVRFNFSTSSVAVELINAQWITPFGRESEADLAKRSYKVENSDFLTLHRVSLSAGTTPQQAQRAQVFCVWREACNNGTHINFCRKTFLNHQTMCQIEELRQQFFGLLADAGLANMADATYTPPGKIRLRFLRISATLDQYSSDPRMVMSCVGASMFPKILVPNDGGGWKTLINAAPATVHPTSVNFNSHRRPDFGPNCKFIAYFNIMQSKRLYVWENGPVDEQSVLLLCGSEVDFKLAAHTISLDRNRVRVRVDAKTALVLKRLRAKYIECLSAQLKGKDLTVPQKRWWSFISRALSSPDKESRRSREESLSIANLTAVKVVLNQ